MPVTVTRHGDSAGDLAAAALARNSHGDVTVGIQVTVTVLPPPPGVSPFRVTT